MDNLPAKGSNDRTELMVKTKLFDIDNNIAAALSYVPLCLANVIFSVMWCATEPKSNRFLRHHAMQSLILTGAYAIASVGIFITSAVLGVIPFVGILSVFTSLFGGILGLAFICGNLYLMYCAYKGKDVNIPYISAYADKFES